MTLEFFSLVQNFFSYFFLTPWICLQHFLRMSVLLLTFFRVRKPKEIFMHFPRHFSIFRIFFRHFFSFKLFPHNIELQDFFLLLDFFFNSNPNKTQVSPSFFSFLNSPIPEDCPNCDSVRLRNTDHWAQISLTGLIPRRGLSIGTVRDRQVCVEPIRLHPKAL